MSRQIGSSGDNDDLEALFDSIVRANSQPEKPAFTPAPAPAPVAEQTMQQAVDDVVSAFAGMEASALEPAPAPADPAPAASVSAAVVPEVEPSLGGESSESSDMYSQIGHITRKLHQALRDLGYDKALEKAASSIPDARDRLAYVATMTEQAAERALNAVEASQPIQDKLERDAEALSQEWQRLFDKKLGVEEFKQLVGRTRSYLQDVPNQTRATNSQLLEIMMAQDFQDLTGQVIKKIVEMAKEMESHLLNFLVEFSPAEKKVELNAGLTNGPVYNPEARTDVVTSQQQVDDLLESLGF